MGLNTPLVKTLVKLSMFSKDRILTGNPTPLHPAPVTSSHSLHILYPAVPEHLAGSKALNAPPAPQAQTILSLSDLENC